MAIKELQTRIALKYDSYAHWTDESVAGKGANLVLLAGELGICAIENKDQGAQTAPTVLFKVGDGTTPFKGLKWASALAADVYGWAKSETVILDGTIIKFKTGDVVNHTISLDSFATDAEVEAVRSALDARIKAVEDKFSGDASVEGQIAGLDARLDVIEGEGEGSVKKALADAKTDASNKDAVVLSSAQEYADSKAGTAESNAKAYAKEYADGKDAAIQAAKKAGDDAAAALNTYKGEMVTALAGKQDVIPENTYDAHGAAAQALTDAKAYTNAREVEIKNYADQAEADAKSYVDGKVSVQATKDSEQDTAIEANATAIAKEAGDRATAVSNAITEVKAYADTAEAGAVATAKGYTNAREAAIKTAYEAYADSKAAAVSAEVSAEATARAEADEAIDARLDKIEAFFDTKDAEGNTVEIDKALDTLVEIQKYITEDGTAAGAMVEDIEANAEAIKNLGDRMDAAEDDIDALEAKDIELANADTALGGRIDALVGDNGTIAVGDAATLASAKKYADDQDALLKTELQGYADTAESDAIASAKTYTDGQVSGLKATLEAADRELSTEIGKKLAESAFTEWKNAHENGHAKLATEITTEITNAVNGEKSARESADNAINAKIGGSYSGTATVHDAIEAVKSSAGTNASAISALDTRVGTAEGNITEIVKDGGKIDVAKQAAIAAAASDATSKANAAETAAKGYADGIVATQKGRIDDLVGDVADNADAISAIQEDYLKAADLFIIRCGTSTTNIHE